MKRITTVQDLINELMSVRNKEAEINICLNDEEYLGKYYNPKAYYFFVVDFTGVDDEKIRKRAEIRIEC